MYDQYHAAGYDCQLPWHAASRAVGYTGPAMPTCDGDRNTIIIQQSLAVLTCHLQLWRGHPILNP